MSDRLVDWSASNGHPPFDACSSITLEPALRRVLASTARELTALEESFAAFDQPSYDDIIPALERCGDAFERVWGLANHLRSVCDHPALRHCMGPAT